MGPKKKQVGAKTLTERLDRWYLNPESDPEMSAVATESWQKSLDSYKYDKSAVTTQNRRERHLKEYPSYILGTAKVTQAAGSEEELLWGKDRIESNLRAYIRFCAKQVAPRAYHSQSIKFNTLVQRRQSLMYHVSRKCPDSVSRKEMWEATSQALYHSFRQENLSTAQEEKVYFTKLDMIHLLEHSQYTSYNADNAQQQHVAWLLAYICGVRPGTIGYAKFYKDQFLSWKDVKITRTGKNNFAVKVLFKWLKGYRNETLKPLRFTIGAPTCADDVPYSLGHRLLAIALRRHYLRDYDSLDAVLADTKVNIAFKPEALDLPVVCASTPKGLELVLKTPASSNALSNFMQRAAIDYGLPSGITLYAWRRSAGTNVANATNADIARGILGHEMQAHTFETSYQQGSVAIDVLNIAMGRKGRNVEELVDSVVVNRIEVATTNKDRWIKKFIKDDENYQQASRAEQEARVAFEEDPDDDDKSKALDQAVRTLSLTTRSLRLQAQHAFQKAQLEEVASKLTMEEIERRTAEAQKGGELKRFLDEVAEEARRQHGENETRLRKAANAARSQPIDPDEAEEQDGYEVQDLADVRTSAGQVVEGMEEDEDVVQTVDVHPLEVESEVRGSRLDDAEQAAIAATGKAMLERLVNDGGKFAVEQPCRLCEEDETVLDQGDEDVEEDEGDEEEEGGEAEDDDDDEVVATSSRRKGKKAAPKSKAKKPKSKSPSNYKGKLWMPGQLRKHLGGDFHSPKSKWLRKFSGSKNKCPFGSGCKTTGTGAALLRHVLTTTGQSDEHLLAAAKAGLFSRDFDPRQVVGVSHQSVKKLDDGTMGWDSGADPREVPLHDLVHPRNLNLDGEIDDELEQGSSLQRKSKTIFRLPTNEPLTSTALWNKHEEGVHGSFADVLQQQREYLANLVDTTLRQHGVRADSTGGTVSKKYIGDKRMNTIGKLRKRLEVLDFAWADSIDDAENADNDMEEGAGAGTEGEQGQDGEDDGEA